MSNIDILVGTTLGGAEYVADEIAAVLTRSDHDCQIHLSPARSKLRPDSLWFIVSSTHGAGDLPDNIQPFFNEIAQDQPDLSQQKFIICAIGDSNYDTFCQGPAKLEKLLLSSGARAIVDKIEIDIVRDPIAEEAATSWIATHIDRI